MIHRELSIGKWAVEFYFAVDGYDTTTILDRMYTFGANASALKEALALMDEQKCNTGFTFANPEEHLVIIAIGPTTDSSEFINTLVHELHHLAVVIANSLGVDLEEETPAYIAGDAARDLAEVICSLGCHRCHSTER